jgi:hypothetical protein
MLQWFFRNVLFFALLQLITDFLLSMMSSRAA